MSPQREFQSGQTGKKRPNSNGRHEIVGMIISVLVLLRYPSLEMMLLFAQSTTFLTPSSTPHFCVFHVHSMLYASAGGVVHPIA